MSRFVGRYEIRERIGQGAMAHVYKAHDPSIDRDLAIKVLRREFSKDKEYAQRFVREAKAAGALSHPNIVTIYDVGAIEGFPYIAMELLDGEPLDELVARVGRLSANQVIDIGVQLAEALRYAHGQGVVHRDIKPANIVLCDGGRTIKILDFGIARLAGTADGGDPNLLRTQVGQVIGTPRYMSPEQALGQELDGRSDLFAVGAVLYELVTGRQAFVGESLTAVAIEIAQHDPKPINELAPECPPGLRFIIEKLLAKKPDRRFANGAQLAEALERERMAHQASLEEAKARQRYLPFQARFALLLAGATSVALALSIAVVLNVQYRAMERVAVTSGTSIVSFVAANVAPHAAENAALPVEQQDWLPVQAFVASASGDPNVVSMVVTDSGGVVRAASQESLTGRPYARPAQEAVVMREADFLVTRQGRDAFRFERPITYAGREFGAVHITLSRAALTSAAEVSGVMMAIMALITLAAVIAASYAIARLLVPPVRRLRRALDAATAGDLDFRISHMRKDEFGELFEAFNRFMESVQADARAGLPPETSAIVSLDATRITPPAPANEVGPSPRRAAQRWEG